MGRVPMHIPGRMSRRGAFDMGLSGASPRLGARWSSRGFFLDMLSSQHRGCFNIPRHEKGSRASRGTSLASHDKSSRRPSKA